MIGKLLGKVVDTGGDIIRRHQEGKISLSEAEAELRKLGLSLEETAIKGAVGLNMADAQSDDPVRTRWRPLGAIAITTLFVVAITITLLFIISWVSLEPDKAALLLDLVKYLGWIVMGLFGIREGGKMVGNR